MTKITKTSERGVPADQGTAKPTAAKQAGMNKKQ
jgi:hypothetical protein